ncbi:hypothetical protein [Acinetobacter sp.]|uniref:hypothetical protein n=1 Tax=Acinetobacter sp. TaxID=472 RepID=UPI002FC9444D
MKMISKIMIGLALALSTTISNTAAIAGWNLHNPTPQGASVLYDASKNVVGAVQKSSVLITPNTAEVARVLRGGAAGYALSIAIDQLLGAVDWVLDPANNQVQFKPVNCTNAPTCMPNYSYLILINNSKYYADGKQQVACQDWLNAHPSRPYYWKNLTVVADEGYYKLYGATLPNGTFNGNIGATYRRVKNTAYDPDKSGNNLSLDVVADKVIENAQNNNADAQSQILLAAENIISEAENDSEKAQPIAEQLEDNATVAGGAPKPNTISHDREKEILDMKPNDPCDEIKQGVKDLDETIQWRKSDLNPDQKGQKIYVGHQKRIKVL